MKNEAKQNVGNNGLFSPCFLSALLGLGLGFLITPDLALGAIALPDSPHAENMQARGAILCSRWNHLRDTANGKTLPPDEILELATVLGWINGYIAATEMERQKFSTNTNYDAWWSFLDKGCLKFPDYDLGRMVQALFFVLPEIKNTPKPK